MLEEAGINISLMIAGAAGAFIKFNKHKVIPWQERLLMIVSGTLSANYLSPIVIDLLHISKTQESYGVAFLIGFGGLKSVEAIYDFIVEFVKSRG